MTESKADVSSNEVDRDSRERLDGEQFDPDLQGTESLKTKTVSGAAYNSAGRVAGQVIQILSAAVLARLLEVEDFGKMAKIMIVTQFIQMNQQMGLHLAIIQRDKVGSNLINSVFWFNVLIGGLATILLCLAAPWISALLNDHDAVLTRMMRFTALGFLITGLSTVPMALISRKIRYGWVATINVTCILLGGVTSIVLALLDFGVWSLVWGTLTGHALGVIMSFSISKWFPSLPSFDRQIKGMLSFGGFHTAYSNVHYFGEKADKALIGRVLGDEMLGFYNRAFQLLLMPMRQIVWPIAAVAIPALSRLQNDPDQFRQYFYRAVNTLAYITIPLIFTIAALSTEIILLMAGEKWLFSATIFKILAIYAVIYPLSSTMDWVYLPLGNSRRLFYWGLIAVPLTILSYFIGLHWGAIGVAVSYVACMALLFVPQMLFAFHKSPIVFSRFMGHIWRPFLVGLASMAAVEGSLLALHSQHFLLRLFSGPVVGLAAAFLAIQLIPGARKESANVLRVFRMVPVFNRLIVMIQNRFLRRSHGAAQETQ